MEPSIDIPDCDSIREWGWTNPVLVDEDGGLIAGNRIEGFADDAIALIDCRRCVVRDNWVKGIRSRIAAFSGQDITFHSNFLERQAGADGPASRGARTIRRAIA